MLQETFLRSSPQETGTSSQVNVLRSAFVSFKRSMPVLGLTGGVATGKTLVTDYLKSRGVPVVDADALSREVVRMGEPAHAEIKEAFGPEFFHDDGTLDRQKLGNLIFEVPERRKRLEAIIHPRVYALAWKEIRSLQEGSPDRLIVFSVPLLFETSHENEVDKVVVVYADENTQTERLMRRDGLTRAAAAKRISSQISIERKREAADYVIRNTGKVREALQEVDGLLRRLQS